MLLRSASHLQEENSLVSSGLQYTAISLKPDVGGAQLGPPIQFAFMREALRLFHGVSNYYLSLRTFPTKWKGAKPGGPQACCGIASNSLYR